MIILHNLGKCYNAVCPMTQRALWISSDSCYSIPRCATLSSLIQFPVKAFTRISPLYEVLPSTRVTLMTIYTTVTNRHIRNIIMIVLCMYCKAWKKLYKWFLCQHIKCVFKSPDCIWEWWFYAEGFRFRCIICLHERFLLLVVHGQLVTEHPF